MTDRGLVTVACWGAQLRDARLRRRRLVRRAAGVAGLLAALATTLAVPPAPWLVWNVSASAPVGLYGVGRHGDIAVGDMVIAQVPARWRMFAARRHYIPANVPLVKRVAAASGYTVCASGPDILVDGRRVARRRTTDGAGRPLPWWQGCVTLHHGSLLLLMDDPASFDGRYFGVTGQSDVVGKAKPLWTR